MATSINSGKSQVKKYIQQKGYSRILDIGVGKGTYGLLFEDEVGYYIVGIDVLDYREKYPKIKKVYDEYHVFDMREVERIRKLGEFDVIILGDVLEHLTVEDAQFVLSHYKKQCKCLIVAVPYECPQIVKNNHYENHLQPDLTDEIFRERYPDFKLFKMYNKLGKPYYGYYVWEKNK